MREELPMLALTALMACNGDKVSKLDTAGTLPDSAGAPVANAGLSEGRNPGCIQFALGCDPEAVEDCTQVASTQLQELLASLNPEGSDYPGWDCEATLNLDGTPLTHTPENGSDTAGEVAPTQDPVGPDGAGGFRWKGITDGALTDTHQICISLADTCSGTFQFVVADPSAFVTTEKTYLGAPTGFPVDLAEISQYTCNIK